MKTETRPAVCPQCQNPDALCTHGLKDEHGHWLHRWDCPTCGNSTAVVLDGCPTCEQYTHEVTFHGTAEIETILPGPYHKDREVAFVEVVHADSVRRWLVACNGFTLVVQPFQRDCVLEHSGVVETRDIKRVRAESDSETFHLPVYKTDDYPDVDNIIQERVLDQRFTPVAVLDVKMLYDMARAMHHGHKEPDRLRVVLCAEITPAEQKRGTIPTTDSTGVGILVIPADTDPDWETRPWGYIMQAHPGKPSAVQLLRQVYHDIKDRIGRSK